ncbi:MAG: ATP-grasp domain-containing protein [Dehalococcoidales bacterium]|jgi:D-alanine-D-alanine ligase|nr:ATP-grasp domain-containing protein [Dehalococcoidales bacterium]
MRIGLAYDLKVSVPLDEDSPEDALEEYDSRETVEIIAAALTASGHSVVLLGGGGEFLENILREKVDIVFNIAEGRGNSRSRESQVPAVLEMLGIPYTGSDSHCLTVCLDKPLAKKLVAAEGVATPQWQLIADEEELTKIDWKQFPFPAIVKPAYEGSSKGIRLTSVVESREQITKEANRLLNDYRQPVMVEEFISGDEVTVGIIGNTPPRVTGIMRILPRNKEKRFVYSLEVKRDYLNLVDYESPPKLADEIKERISLASLKVFQVLGCRDFARIDFRVSPDGVPYFLEINPLPGLGSYSDLIIMAQKMGWTHQGLIQAVLEAALKRCSPCVPA